jgi:2-polyprenyl-3-methyl-5-hydroxy-6-metoxy-1,4-benzoquinol methylase
MAEGDRVLVPLNQTYRMARTFECYPAVRESFETFMTVLRLSGFRHTPEGEARFWGRTYDYACIVNSGIDFEGKVVADLGARDGFLGAWLTGQAAMVHVSDYFEEWGKGTEHDLGSFEHWRGVWEAMAPKPERLKCERQDLRALDLPDDSFDVVICTSVIEHIHQHDSTTARRWARLCGCASLVG